MFNSAIETVHLLISFKIYCDNFAMYPWPKQENVDLDRLNVNNYNGIIML